MKAKLLTALALSLALIALSGCNPGTAGTPPADESASPVDAPAAEVENPADAPAAESENPADAPAAESENPADAPAPGDIIPDQDTFLTRFNAAAEELGVDPIDPAVLEDLSWHGEDGLVTVEEGFLYQYEMGIMMFDPYYVRLTMFIDETETLIPIIAATASGVTGLPGNECLAAMTEMVASAEEDTWENGYEVNLSDMELGGVKIEYEYGRSTGNTQVFFNPAGLRLSNETFG